MRKLFGFICAVLLSSALVTPASAAPPVAQPPRNQASIEARKRVAEAQAALKELQDEEKRIKDKRRAEIENKEEWKSTIATNKKAKEGFKTAREKALAAVKAKPAYKEAVKNRDAIQKQLDDAQKKRDATAIAKLGTKFSAESYAIKKMESEAMEQDAKSIEAKETLDESDKQVTALNEEVDGTLAADPDYMTLKQQLEQAELALTQARESLDQAVKGERSSRPTPTAKPVKSSKRSSEGP